MLSCSSFSRLLRPLSFVTSSTLLQQQIPTTWRRWKHSNRQVKRLFQQHPARARVQAKQDKVTVSPPSPTLVPLEENPTVLFNGWSAPITTKERPEYPFSIDRTANKPGNALGFLPVYATYRKDGTKATTRIKRVSGDQDFFIQELCAILGLNQKEEVIRIRTGQVIELDGNYTRKVKTWLTGLGF